MPRKLKKVQVKKKKIQKERPEPKRRQKSPGKKQNTDPMEITDVNIPQDNLDINKLRTVTGHGRVSVAADEWITVMEFVQ